MPFLALVLLSFSSIGVECEVGIPISCLESLFEYCCFKASLSKVLRLDAEFFLSLSLPYPTSARESHSSFLWEVILLVGDSGLCVDKSRSASKAEM